MAKIKKSPIDLSTLELLLSYKYIDNSYKLFWFKSLFYKSLNGAKKITLTDLAIEMILGAWDLVAVKNITFGRLDKLHRTIEEIESLYHVSPDISKEDLRILIENIKDKDILALIEDLYEDTPYQFVEPLYMQKLKGASYNKKKNLIIECTLSDPFALYQIDSVSHCIVLNNEWITYMKRHQKQIEGVLHDSLAYFLDKHAVAKR